MEDVLAVYERPYDAARPVVVCVDEARKELRTTPRGNLPTEPGSPGVDRNLAHQPDELLGCVLK